MSRRNLYVVRDEPIADYPIRFIPSRNQPPSFGEKLVEFMRRWQFRIGIACYIVAVAVGCYFAFQVGRGLVL